MDQTQLSYCVGNSCFVTLMTKDTVFSGQPRSQYLWQQECFLGNAARRPTSEIPGLNLDIELHAGMLRHHSGVRAGLVCALVGTLLHTIRSHIGLHAVPLS